jgi:hypothetical protein
MPRVNPEVLVELLETIQTQLGTANSLSRNNDITTILERVSQKVEQIIQTIQRELIEGEKE